MGSLVVLSRSLRRRLCRGFARCCSSMVTSAGRRRADRMDRSGIPASTLYDGICLVLPWSFAISLAGIDPDQRYRWSLRRQLCGCYVCRSTDVDGASHVVDSASPRSAVDRADHCVGIESVRTHSGDFGFRCIRFHTWLWLRSAGSSRFSAGATNCVDSRKFCRVATAGTSVPRRCLSDAFAFEFPCRQGTGADHYLAGRNVPLANDVTSQRFI